MYLFRHLNKRENKIVYPLLKEQQKGEYCNVCKRTKDDLKNDKQSSKLVIDRKDNTKGYFIQDSTTGGTTPRLNNLQLACYSCNNKKDQNKPKVEDRKMTPEMVVNRRAEPFFRKWVRGIIESEGKIEYDDAVSSGAEFIGIHVETTKNYLKKMLSSRYGDYEIGWGKGGGTYIYEKGKSPKSLEEDYDRKL